MRPFEKALLKHGFDRFDFRDLMTNVPEEMLDQLEKYFISYFHSNERPYGYNCEGGGNRCKSLSEDTKNKIREKNSPRRRWSHRKFGVASRTLHEINTIDPEATITGLQSHLCGVLCEHHGWVCLDVPLKKNKKRIVRVWGHPRFGEFIGSSSGLCRRFPEQGLKSQTLAVIANPNSDEKSHKKWRYVREPTDEELLNCYLLENH